MICFGNPTHADHIAAAVGIYFNPACDQVIANAGPTGLVYGGVLYTGATGASIQVHVAGFEPNWLSRDMLWVAFHYPFVQLRCKLLLASISSANVHALAFNAKLGFKDIARVPDVYGDGDLILRGMRRDECKWLALTPRTIQEKS